MSSHITFKDKMKAAETINLQNIGILTFFFLWVTWWNPDLQNEKIKGYRKTEQSTFRKRRNRFKKIKTNLSWIKSFVLLSVPGQYSTPLLPNVTAERVCPVDEGRSGVSRKLDAIWADILGPLIAIANAAPSHYAPLAPFKLDWPRSCLGQV